MARHFGTKLSGWQATGAGREPSASSGKYAPRDSNSFDERELGAGILVALLFAAPVIIVFGMVFFYMALIA